MQFSCVYILYDIPFSVKNMINLEFFRDGEGAREMLKAIRDLTFDKSFHIIELAKIAKITYC